MNITNIQKKSKKNFMKVLKKIVSKKRTNRSKKVKIKNKK